MSNIHEQAMHYIYQQVLDRLMEHMTQSQRATVQLLVQRLLIAGGGVEQIGQFRLLVLHGHDRCNARLLAFLRAAQLCIALRAPATFQLQVVIGCRPALGQALLEDLERTFSALFLHDDPRVELLMLKGGQAQPFSVRPMAPSDCSEGEREALLIFGHLAQGQPEAVLGSRLHLELAAAALKVIDQPLAPDALITAVPLRQQQRYLAWARSSLRLAGERGAHSVHQSCGVLFELLGRLRAVVAMPLERWVATLPRQSSDSVLRLISVDDLLGSASPDDRLAHMLGLRGQAIAQQSDLSAYFDPSCLAYLHALRVRVMAGAVGSACRRGERESGKTLFQQTYGIGDNQLICLLYAPFADEGKGLEAFVQSCHPAMRVALPYLHRALQGKPCPEAVVHWLIETSGLNMAQLRMIYSGQVSQPAGYVLASLARRDAQLRLLPRLPRQEAAMDRKVN